jgi:outer membrane protein OmpA-like peptidoglycan-associated protein
VQAGLAPTTQRMNDFGTYEALATSEVLFASGSTKISDQGKSDLMAFAEKAKGTNGYHVVLQGFTGFHRQRRGEPAPEPDARRDGRQLPATEGAA